MKTVLQIIIILISALTNNNSFGQKHPIYALEQKLMQGEQSALFDIAKYFDSKKEITEFLGYHIINTNESEKQHSLQKKSTMNRKYKSLLPPMAFVVLLGLQSCVNTVLAQAPGQQQRATLALIPIKSDTTHTLSTHFTRATGVKKAPNAKGFIQRWLVLEPIKKDIARNNIFTDNYLRTTFSTDNFSNDFTAIPKNGETVKVGDQELKWYALDSKVYNFNLFHFTYAVNKPQYGVLFWVVTVINCPEEIKNVRMAAGCNSASMWWLNGKEVLMLSGDRDMIVDNCTSSRLTLNKGKNIIRGAVINGPGMCNFCVRFLDEKGLPIKNFTISYE